MQYWVFFIGGAGGDGFSNLLEHANNVYPCDGNLLWRVRTDKSYSDKIAFYCPQLFTEEPYFLKHPILEGLDKIKPTATYWGLIHRGKNTVIPIHPWYYDYNPEFKYWSVLEKDQHRILLYSDDIHRVVDDYNDKNYWVKNDREIRINELSHDISPYWGHTHSPIAKNLKYDTFIDIERAWRDWDYLNNILTSIGIDLDRKYYEEYLDVAKRRY